MEAAGQPLSTLLEAADTIPDEVSPRKLDLVGFEGIRRILAEMGRVNSETGEPLSYQRVVTITKTHPDFPKPWVEVNDGEGSDLRPRRYWRRADIEKWASTWDQRAGNPGSSSSPQRRKRGG